MSTGENMFNFEYDITRTDLRDLYERAKRDQWNASTHIDWAKDVDPERGILEDQQIPIYGTGWWERLTRGEQARLNHYWSTWRFSQNLHGEQGGLLIAAQVVAAMPSIEGKLCMGVQVVDEARHTEVFERYLREKMRKRYPVNASLLKLMQLLISESRWYVKLVGIQLIIENLARASFRSSLRGAKDDLIRDILTNVLRDENRHVAFGVLSIRRVVLEEISAEEREELTDFAFEACRSLVVERFFPS